MSQSDVWTAIFNAYGVNSHDFRKPFLITAKQIKDVSKSFSKTSEKEVRILCKQDTREDRPSVFKEKELFLLPKKNGEYYIIKGEGYVDIPVIKKTAIKYKSKLDFNLETSKVGDSEMQHLDYAYASSLIRTFINDPSLVLTIRGRKYTPSFGFKVGAEKIEVSGVQTEVDAGYEGKNKVVLIEAKNSSTTNTIIRQLYYPYRQWKSYTKKEVIPIFFEKNENIYNLWQFEFVDPNNYNSIKLKKNERYEIIV